MEDKDSILADPSGVEVVSGHLVTQGAATLVGAITGNFLAALLPVLSGTLASKRQQQRVEHAIREITAQLQRHSEKLERLTDEQYKVVSEAILAMFYTTDPAKLDYLKRAVANGVEASDIVPQESATLSRIVRDISAEEADFLIKNFGYDRIQLSKAIGSRQEGDWSILVVNPLSREGIIVSGLLGMGLLIPGESTWGDVGLLQFAQITAKVIAILREPSPE